MLIIKNIFIILNFQLLAPHKCILNRDEKPRKIQQKVGEKILQRRYIQFQINSRFLPAADLKKGIFVLVPKFTMQKYQKGCNPSKKDHVKSKKLPQMSHTYY